MNKQFVIKMLQAEHLRYEALKEILPDNILNKIENLENELLTIGKECFMKGIINQTNNSPASEMKAGIRKVEIE